MLNRIASVVAYALPVKISLKRFHSINRLVVERLCPINRFVLAYKINGAKIVSPLDPESKRRFRAYGFSLHPIFSINPLNAIAGDRCWAQTVAQVEDADNNKHCCYRQNCYKFCPGHQLSHRLSLTSVS